MQMKVFLLLLASFCLSAFTEAQQTVVLHMVEDLVRVAIVRVAPMVRRGFATQNGNGEIVIGVAMMLLGENSRIVSDRVKQSLAEIEKTLLQVSRSSHSTIARILLRVRFTPSCAI
jgi:Cu/Ag efflux pump CusA